MVNLIEKSGVKQKDYFQKFYLKTFELLSNRNEFIVTNDQCCKVILLLRELSRRDNDEFVILSKLANVHCKRGQTSLIQECNDNFCYKIDWNNIIVCPFDLICCFYFYFVPQSAVSRLFVIAYFDLYFLLRFFCCCMFVIF